VAACYGDSSTAAPAPEAPAGGIAPVQAAKPPVVISVSTNTSDAIEAAIKAAGQEAAPQQTGVQLRNQSFESLEEEERASAPAASTSSRAMAASLD